MKISCYTGTTPVNAYIYYAYNELATIKMKQTYKSKKDTFFRILIWGPTIIVTVLMVIRQTDQFDAFKTIPIEFLGLGTIVFWIFALLVWFRTEYIITDDELILRFALFYTYKLKIGNIKSITKSGLDLWVLALSSDCLKIQSEGIRDLTISPKQKDQFLSRLSELNPNIEIRK